MKSRILLAGFAALLIAGCSTLSGTPRPAESASLISASAVVQSVDQETRQVVLVGEDGSTIGMVAGPEIRNLPQVTAGDVVTIDYYESVLLSMGDPDQPGTTVVAGQSPEGAMPAGVAGVNTNVVVTVVSYDPNSALATYRTPDGMVHRTTVPPELRSFAAARAPGSRVNVSLTQAIAVAITEA